MKTINPQFTAVTESGHDIWLDNNNCPCDLADSSEVGVKTRLVKKSVSNA